jgi:glutamyl-tRNA reductase
MKFSTIAVGTAIAIASLGDNHASAFSFTVKNQLTQITTRASSSSSLSSSLTTTSLSMIASNEIAPGMKRKRTKQERLEAASKGLQVHVVGLSIHHASVEVREKLAIAEADWNSAANAIVSTGEVSEAAILSTCNRFEVYYSASDARQAMAAVTNYLAERSGLSVSVLRKNLFMLSGDDAVWHVMRVSGGLDSLVVGEGQILSQVRQCHLHSIEEDGCGGKVLSRMLNNAVCAGKRVRSETAIAKGSVSISSAAVELSEMYSLADLNIPFSEARLAVVGAGKMTRLLITHLASRGLKEITIVNRSLQRPQELQEQFPDVDIDIRLVDDLWDVIGRSDIVYTATSSTGYLIDEALLEENGLAGGRPLMLVDISVPRNIAEDCKMVPSVAAYNVDDLKAVVAKNTAMRQREMIEAETLLREEASAFSSWRESLSAVPTINQLQEKANALRRKELEKCTKKLSSSNPNLTDKELEAVERLSRGIVNKLLHGPMTHLRKTESIEDKKATLKELSAMFRLEEEVNTNGRAKPISRRK